MAGGFCLSDIPVLVDLCGGGSGSAAAGTGDGLVTESAGRARESGGEFEDGIEGWAWREGRTEKECAHAV